MTISIRFSELDGVLLRKYAEFHKLTVSDLVREIVFERIEEEYNDLLRKAEVMRLKQ